MERFTMVWSVESLACTLAVHMFGLRQFHSGQRQGGTNGACLSPYTSSANEVSNSSTQDHTTGHWARLRVNNEALITIRTTLYPLGNFFDASVDKYTLPGGRDMHPRNAGPREHTFWLRPAARRRSGGRVQRTKR
ncbi:hypothetical protein BD309DRAFT_597123 [Dichomitus squalens]|nr:hypothetical protein BD309DRAFT_597123 [Dichomitus squalens]